MNLDHAIEAAAEALSKKHETYPPEWHLIRPEHLARIAIEAAASHIRRSWEEWATAQEDRAERAETEIEYAQEAYSELLENAEQRAEKAGAEVERLQSQTMFWEDRANNTEEAFMDERNLCNELGWMLQHIATYGTNSVAKPQITDLVERFRKTR